MYKIKIDNIDNKYEFEELAKVFMPRQEFEILLSDEEFDKNNSDEDNVDSGAIGIDNAETDIDKNIKIGADYKESDTNKTEIGADNKESDTNKTETGADYKESDTDKTETGADNKESDTNKTETGADYKESDTDKTETDVDNEYILAGADTEKYEKNVYLEINKSLNEDKNTIKGELYTRLSEIFEKKPDWGILTGVRPVKLAGELADKFGTDEAYNLLIKKYLLSEKKAKLIMEIFSYQKEKLGIADDKSCGVYIGIPFCPTRCLYCSFTSNQAGEREIAAYLDALLNETDYVSQLMHERGYHSESVYIGGGTPTTLNAEQLKRLLDRAETAFGNDSLKEFTVEAGRPDTITRDKLSVMKEYGVDRISINPQTMKADTLRLIGRAHTPEMIREAVAMAGTSGIKYVNMDVIAGLPEESEEDFADTLQQIIDFKPQNITVHSLAVKRASRLIDQDRDFHYKQGELVGRMLDKAEVMLRKSGYRPYYLYRQKHMAGALENVGWCREDALCIYNVRIMEEHQTIAALGAGGISKQYYPEENRLERVANVSNYEIYMERFSEMMKRKELNLFI